MRLWVGGAHLGSLFAESALDCPLVGVHLFGDLGGGPAVFVELRSLVDLFGAQAGSTHRYVVPAQDPADRLSVDLEQVAQFVYGCAGLVASDELFGLVGFEMSYTSGLVPFGRWGRGRRRVGQLASSVSRASTWGFVL